MSNTISRLTAGLLALAAALLLLPIGCFAAGVQIAVGTASDIREGKEFTVTVGFSADSEIGRVAAVLAYSADDVEFVGSSYAQGGGGILNISGTPDSSTKEMNIPVVFRAKNGGTSHINVTNGSVMSPEGKMLGDLLTAELAVTAEGEPRPLPPAEAEDSLWEETPSLPETAVSIAEEQADSSSESESLPAQDSSVTESSSVPDDGGLARLKSLTVSAGKLKPDFSPDVFEYEVTVPPETEYISVDAELKDRYDTIWYEGSEYLGIGMTPWTITVTTPDGTVSHAYFIRVNRHTADYSEPEEESSEVQALTEVSSSEVLEKLEEDNVTRRSVSQTPAPHEEKVTLREKITPILIIAVCVIIAAVGIIVLRIRSRSNNSFRK